ncbi:hypothetical protein Ngar_c03590 [Candidatus Nitrososphaera gargensis Ga9.2]|uniref:Uncharacterized protein n=2 Tax=Candidatus Nitrososphaera gargensis TaxID=497727 RepID=K0IHM3_NITGG|nr:hypothetical protein Ngar_c03300 [Candidatus Nitrososphaera gargensis Ga9.2]AFU57307.1 hypothetical protein Ngar_c03590 [Candidatus Nitrososphaera gargensis Ga9.2]
MIASDSSQTTTRTAKFRNFAMDAEQFIRDNIGLVVFVVFAILIGLALAALFTKPGKKMAAAVAG